MPSETNSGDIADEIRCTNFRLEKYREAVTQQEELLQKLISKCPHTTTRETSWEGNIYTYCEACGKTLEVL